MGSDTPADPVRASADQLRGKKGIEHASAKLELVEGGDGQYVDYFRGKDLVRFVETNPGALKLDRPGKTPDELAAEAVRSFFSRSLLWKTERKFKKPKPGRTRLVKWPRTLQLVQDQQFDPAAFYAWRYDKPTSMWYWVASIAVPVVVILACLFPLAPWWARLALVYTLMAILVALLGLLTLRYVLFAVVWAVSGSSLWVFPNMMSETVSIVEAFTPVVSFKRGSLAKQWQARLATAVLMGGVFWVLSSHTPDMSHLKDDMTRAHDSFREYMDNMLSKDKQYLNGSAHATAGGTPPPGAA